jgi:hypothetical protein
MKDNNSKAGDETTVSTSDPHPALRDFFTYYSLSDVREQLWELLKGAVTGTDHQQPGERAGMLHFYEKLEKFIEAAYLLHTKSEAKPNKRHSSARRRKPRKGNDLGGTFVYFSSN